MRAPLESEHGWTGTGWTVLSPQLIGAHRVGFYKWECQLLQQCSDECYWVILIKPVLNTSVADFVTKRAIVILKT
jgi:hypothetical protein